LRPDTSTLFLFKRPGQPIKGQPGKHIIKMGMDIKKITALKAGKNPSLARSSVYLDGKFAFSLDNEVILKNGLKVGQTLSPAQVNGLKGDNDSLRCLNAAYQFLSARPRSQNEIVQRLKKRGFGQADIESTVQKLRQLKLVDDEAFAEYWQENRTAFRPRSQRALKVELRQKGVATELIQAAVEKVDESEGAYQAAAAKARRMATLDYREFRQKLGGFLQRRGFSYGIIKTTVKRVWQEKTGNGEPPEISGEETGTGLD
jgi:regulatory protein